MRENKLNFKNNYQSKNNNIKNKKKVKRVKCNKFKSKIKIYKEKKV